MDVRIGIMQTARELDIELTDSESREEIVARVEAALAAEDGILWLTDKRGRAVAVPASKIAYVEIGSAIDERRVGFGAS